MKLGTIHLWGDDLAAFRSDIRLASDLGYEYIGIGDSPAGWHELYLSMAVAIQEAGTAIVMPMVSSPFLRHPIITANCLSTLYDLSGGRVAAGYATGGSTAMSIGCAPATQVEVRAEIRALRDLFAGQG